MRHFKRIKIEASKFEIKIKWRFFLKNDLKIENNNFKFSTLGIFSNRIINKQVNAPAVVQCLRSLY